MENLKPSTQPDFFSSEIVFDPEEFPEITIEESNIDSVMMSKESSYGVNSSNEDPCPKLSALLAQIPLEKKESLKTLITELKTLAKIPHPPSPIEQYRKKLKKQNGDIEVPEEILEAVWEDVPSEEKKKLQYDYQKAMEIYKPQRQLYFAKVNELRNILGLPILKYSKTIKLLKPFKIYKKEIISRVRIDKPEARAKDLMPMIKEQWTNMKRGDKRIYVLIARRENERAIHEVKMKELDDEINVLQRKRFSRPYY